MQLTLIEVPYDCGRFGERCGGGPLALSDELPAALAAAGHQVDLRQVRLPPRFFAEVAAVQALQPAVRQEVAAARAGGSLPVVLAGNCGVAALGAVAALPAPTGVLWLDAHADFNTPETSPSGFFDGMALATLVGRCWAAVTPALDGFAATPEEHVVLLGARDLDAEERRSLLASGVAWLRPEQVRGELGGDEGGPLGAALAALARRAPRLYLHLDLDVLDPTTLVANQYATPDGLSADEVAAAVAAAAARLEIAAVGITALDPLADAGRRGPTVAARLLAAIAAAAAGRMPSGCPGAP